MGRTSKRTYIFDRVKDKTGERAPGNNKAPGIIRPGYTPGYLQARILKK